MVLAPERAVDEVKDEMQLLGSGVNPRSGEGRSPHAVGGPRRALLGGREGACPPGYEQIAQTTESNTRVRLGAARDQRGAVYVEFLLAFVPLFTLFLGVTQISLIFGAQLVVEHAATRAARSAAVVLDDDPRYYHDEPRNHLRGAPLGPDDLEARIDDGGRRRRAVSRRGAVEMSAAMVLLPLAARPSGDSIRAALGWAGRRGAIEQTLDRMSVDFVRPPAPDADGREGRAELITVKVRYRFACIVPVVRRLVCDGDDEKWLEAERTVTHHRASLDYASGDWGEP